MFISKYITLVASLSLLVHETNALPSQQAEKSKAIEHALEEIVQREKIPGMVAAIASSDGIMAISSAGVRKEGSSKELTIDDHMHLGSCTKAMTSVLIATLVREKKIKWETTLIEVFPRLKKELHPDYHDVTVWDLLTHRSGIPANAKDWWTHQDMKLQKRCLKILEDNLEDAPPIKRGEYLYSNLGYMVAGCMAEQVTKKTWEVLMQERIFDPLGMESAGFGPPGQPGRIKQPWGHPKSDGEWQPSQTDNPEIMGPAGRVHCSLEDWAKFIALQLPGKNALSLDQKLLEKLITPVGEYAGGWIITKRPWGKGTVLTHAGSNTMWYAIVWVAPKTNRAYLVATNSSDNDSHTICDRVIGKLIEIDGGS